MKARDLLAEIRENIKDYDIKYLEERIKEKDINPISKQVIAKFFDGCSPESEEIFKRFITYICVYLSLIAKKPLHPVGMDFRDGKTVFTKEEDGKINYYCDIRKDLKNRSKDYFTCKFCLCKEVK